MHRYHPAGTDDPDALVWDDCDDCARNAASPLSRFDDERLWALWQLVQEVELGVAGRTFYRNATEAQAASALYAVYAAVSNRPQFFAHMMDFAEDAARAREAAHG